MVEAEADLARRLILAISILGSSLSLFCVEEV